MMRQSKGRLDPDTMVWSKDYFMAMIPYRMERARRNQARLPVIVVRTPGAIDSGTVARDVAKIIRLHTEGADIIGSWESSSICRRHTSRCLGSGVANANVARRDVVCCS